MEKEKFEKLINQIRSNADKKNVRSLPMEASEEMIEAYKHVLRGAVNASFEIKYLARLIECERRFGLTDEAKNHAKDAMKIAESETVVKEVLADTMPLISHNVALLGIQTREFDFALNFSHKTLKKYCASRRDRILITWNAACIKIERAIASENDAEKSFEYLAFETLADLLVKNILHCGDIDDDEALHWMRNVSYRLLKYAYEIGRKFHPQRESLLIDIMFQAANTNPKDFKEPLEEVLTLRISRL